MRLRPIGTVLRAPAFWDTHPPNWLSDAALPFALVYAAAARLRERLASPPSVAAAPVVCIGSVLVGGSGKTPVTLAVAQRLATTRPDVQVHFLSRGYGGAAPGPLLVEPGVHSSTDVGDEPMLLARLAPTWVGARRSETAALACESGAQLLLMDDGLQHPSLHRDLSLLCVDSAYLLGNGRVLPAGPLREPTERGYAKANAVVAVSYAPAIDGGGGGSGGGSSSSSKHGLPSEAHLRNRLDMPDAMPLLRALLQPEPEAAAQVAGRRLVAFSGIARPQRFFDTLRSLGCVFVVPPVAMPDHAPIDAPTLERLRNRAKAHDALLATTSKDAARLTSLEREGIHVLPARLKWLDGTERMLDELLDSLRT